MSRHNTENYQIALNRIMELERKLVDKPDPLTKSILDFMVSKGLLNEWVEFYKQERKS